MMRYLHLGTISSLIPPGIVPVSGNKSSVNSGGHPASLVISLKILVNFSLSVNGLPKRISTKYPLAGTIGFVVSLSNSVACPFALLRIACTNAFGTSVHDNIVFRSK